ncbi:nucleotidyltransferase substrate binding protein [Algoriphagus yeomjeoni]|uniref:Nucleotidyltransferase substrate binding protein (TIGR01987 family) n=1 Tax=Algoriphagus yeomjeoni TaxID=291403 RepID=A0A327P0M9_9BACT|nr:nucleotidyltransferase substrate binding protein [Algoriphagus yeomjeoni]RAI85819.1 nucleotidyltransferase substrate binding protein (TIGR01987 family) [Algoriphagus yeomjeoni]
MENDIRWKQRFENFEKAVKLLEEIQSLDLAKTSQLEKEGIIQRFEFTLELGWKTLKDRMESDGLVLTQISPKMVVKEAFKAKYIDQIEVWLDMINDRNLLSHTYDFAVMEEVIPDIQKKYSPVLSALFMTLS